MTPSKGTPAHSRNARTVKKLKRNYIDSGHCRWNFGHRNIDSNRGCTRIHDLVIAQIGNSLRHSGIVNEDEALWQIAVVDADSRSTTTNSSLIDEKS